jgi:hypothetical protein
MDEREWLGSPDPVGLLKHLWRSRPYPVRARKLRLLACACLQRLWQGLADESRHAVEVAEAHADGLADEEELQAARPPFKKGSDPAFCAATFTALPSRKLRGCMESVLCYSAWVARGRFADEAGRDTLLGTASCPESVAQSRLVRDIFANPFQPLTLDAACLTPDVLALARAAYEHRDLPSGYLDPQRLAVLADPLEDAGCEDAGLLGHLRGPGHHVRGCHALDAILGRS